MKKYSLEDLRQIYESKRYLTKDRFVHYFVNRYGYSEKASKQAFRLFLEFPKGIYDDEDKKTLDVIIPNAIDLVNGIMNNSHIGYDLDKEKEYKKIIFKENDVVNETVVDMNNSDDIGTYAEIIKRKVDIISVLNICSRIYNEGKDELVFQGDFFNTNDKYWGEESNVYLAQEDDTFVKLNYIKGKGYLINGSPNIDNEREYNSYALSLNKYQKMGNLETDFHLLSGKGLNKKQ